LISFLFLINAKNFFHKILLFFGFALFVQFFYESNGIAQGKLLKAESNPGLYLSKNKKFQFELSVSGMGGFLILSAGPVNQEPKIKVDDVTGVIWLSERVLVSSVSPIYGRPEVFMFDCQTGEIKVLVKPETINQPYPDGEDYFELMGLSEGKREILYFYSKSVENVDLKNFRNETNLRRFRVDR